MDNAGGVGNVQTRLFPRLCHIPLQHREGGRTVPCLRSLAAENGRGGGRRKKREKRMAIIARGVREKNKGGGCLTCFLPPALRLQAGELAFFSRSPPLERINIYFGGKLSFSDYHIARLS